MEKISFLDILSRGWSLSLSRISLFLFGILIALPIGLEVFIKPSSEESFFTLLSQYATFHPFGTLFLILSLFFTSLLGKSGLIIMLNKTEQDNQAAKKMPTLTEFLKAFKRAIQLDISVIGFFILLTIVLSLPALLATYTLGTVPDILAFLSLLVFVPIIIVAFFIREFSYFYFLLSPLKLTSSLGAGANLFMNKRFLSITFGFFSLLITILFTFSFNLVMLGIVVVFQKIVPSLSENIVLLIVSLLYFSWYGVFRQTLWFLFFKSLAAPKDDLPEKEEILLEKKVSEIPSI